MVINRSLNTFSLLFSWHGTILPKILPQLIVVVLLSLLAVSGERWLGITHWQMPVAAFSLLGITLSIFLGFKNSACYDRWWEARKLWGQLVSSSRHLERDSRWLPKADREALLSAVAAFAAGLRDRLRGDGPCVATRERCQRLAINAEPPDLLLSRLAGTMQQQLMDAVRAGHLSDICYTQLNSHVMQLVVVQTNCERIATTPLPFAYTVLLHRTVYLFCLLLPLGVGNSLGWLTPMVVGLMAYTFLGLDALSTEIEEPFGKENNDLPLDFLAALVEREVQAGLGNPSPPGLPQPRQFILR